MVVGSALIVLFCWGTTSSVDAFETSTINYERYLPEDEASYYYSNYYSKNSKKDKGYYDYYGAKGSKSGLYYNEYYGAKGSKSGPYYNKSDKKDKDCKSFKKSKKDYYGVYNHCFEETMSPSDGNFTDMEFDEIFIDDIVTEAPKFWKSKGSKSGYYTKSEKKYDKKMFKSYKTNKKDKSDKKSKFFSRPTPAPVGGPAKPKSPDLGFAPEEIWNLTFKDAVDTGFLFYDPVTKYAWYAYNARVGEDSLISDTTNKAAEASSATIGRICPMNAASTGNVIEDLCIEIMAPEEWKSVTSTEIQTAEACYGTVTGAIFKLAVIVKDSSKVLHLKDSLVGSRMLVYDIVVRGNAVVSEPIIVEVAYEGWKSLYGEPTINGRPSFTSDCKRVYSTWLAPNEEAVDGFNSITIAMDVETATKDGDSAELWRLGTSGRLVGLSPSKDGKTLFSATNVPEDDDLNAGGMLALNARTGQIVQEYIFPNNSAGLSNNAYTNLVMDDSGNSYHIDSLLGLVKFDLDDLNDGPVWSALEGATEETTEESTDTASQRQEARNLAPLTATRDKDSKLLMVEEDAKPVIPAKDMSFMAFRPAIDGTNSNIVFGCGNTVLGNDIDGVIALGAKNGGSFWFAEFDELHAVNVGSCSGITHDILWGPSAASLSGSAIYIGRDKVVQALDSKDGSLLWTYDTQRHSGATQFVVLSDEFVLVANSGTIIALETIEVVKPISSPVQPPTDPVPEQPTNSPTRSPLAPTPARSPLATPAPVMPAISVEVKTSAPTSGASSAFEFVYGTTVLLALPLLLVLMR